MNGTITGSVERKTRKKTADGPAPILAGKPWPFGGFRQLLEVLPDAIEVRGLQRLGDDGRQGVGDELLPRRRSGCTPHLAQDRGVVTPLGEASDEIEGRVDNAPGEIAPERTDEHRAHIVAAHFGDTDRAGERKHHDERENDLGEAFERIENAGAAGGGCHRFCGCS